MTAYILATTAAPVAAVAFALTWLLKEVPLRRTTLPPARPAPRPPGPPGTLDHPPLTPTQTGQP